MCYISLSMRTIITGQHVIYLSLYELLRTCSASYSTVARMKPCVPHLLDVQGVVFRGVRGVDGREACAVHTLNIISQWQ